jgi:hypothetical protein
VSDAAPATEEPGSTTRVISVAVAHGHHVVADRAARQRGTVGVDTGPGGEDVVTVAGGPLGFRWRQDVVDVPTARERAVPIGGVGDGRSAAEH